MDIMRKNDVSKDKYGLVEEVIKNQGNLKGIDLPQKIKEAFLTQSEISYQDELEVVSKIQAYIDNSISKTITIPKGTSNEEIVDMLVMSYNLNIKGLAVFPERNLETTGGIIHGQDCTNI